jgi:two-component system response regulator NreC
MSRATVVLADDHQVVREGLRALLAAAPDLAVVGEAPDGIEALRLVDELTPTVLVVDLMMPGLGGLDVVREVSRRSPRTRTVVLSMYTSPAYVHEALSNGALGYVAKDAAASHLLSAVRAAAAGRRYLSPPLSEASVEAYARRARGAPLDLYQTLTRREREILRLVVQGHTSVEIANRLTISARTVDTHRANLMRKLGLRNQMDLLRYALGRGILPPDGGEMPSRQGGTEGSESPASPI